MSDRGNETIKEDGNETSRTEEERLEELKMEMAGIFCWTVSI